MARPDARVGGKGHYPATAGAEPDQLTIHPAGKVPLVVPRQSISDSVPMRTRLTELFGIDRPIVLAPMGGVAGGALAAAVARAGGLGLIGCGYGDAKAGYGSIEWIDEQFDAAGNEKVGAGFITWSLANRPQLLDRVLDHGTDPIFLSFGDPAPFIPKIRSAGRKTHPPSLLPRRGERRSTPWSRCHRGARV